VVVGAAGVVVTSVLLAQERDSLRENCIVLDEDECRAATSGRLDRAQDAADHIATWKSLRWVSVGTTALGLAAATAGLLELGREGTPNETGGTAELRFSEREIGFGWRSSF
jgi:hypothetical protein